MVRPSVYVYGNDQPSPRIPIGICGTYTGMFFKLKGICEIGRGESLKLKAFRRMQCLKGM